MSTFILLQYPAQEKEQISPEQFYWVNVFVKAQFVCKKVNPTFDQRHFDFTFKYN